MEPPVKFGNLIGYPNQGTHAPGANGLPVEWENNNAVDIAVPYGTPVYAPFTGTIGNEFGAIDTSTLPGNQQSVLQGLRLHVIGNGNEVYLQHLSKFADGIKPGVNVQEGDLIGYSGEANGVQHVHFAVKKGSVVNWLKGLKVTKGGSSIAGSSNDPQGSSSNASNNLAGCAAGIILALAMVGNISWIVGTLLA